MTTKQKKPGRGIYQDGRSNGGPPFIQLHHYLWDHPRFQGLTHTAVRVFIELIRRYNGKNNGLIRLPVRQGERLNMSYVTVSRALRALVKAGFVAVEVQGTADPGKMGGNRASQYRLTFAASFDGKPSTRNWEKLHLKENPSVVIETAPFHQDSAAA